MRSLVRYIDDISQLEDTTNYNEGDIVFCKDSNSVYCFTNSEFIEFSNNIVSSDNYILPHSIIVSCIFVYFIHILDEIGYDYNNDALIMNIINNKYGGTIEDRYIKFDEDYKGVTTNYTYIRLDDIQVSDQDIKDINYIINTLYDIIPDPTDNRIIEFNKLINYIRNHHDTHIS